MGNLHICEGIINAEHYSQVFPTKALLISDDAKLHSMCI